MNIESEVKIYELDGAAATEANTLEVDSTSWQCHYTLCYDP